MEGPVNEALLRYDGAAPSGRRRDGGDSIAKARRRALLRERLSLFAAGTALATVVSIYFLILG
jgi:hypothetical protein